MGRRWAVARHHLMLSRALDNRTLLTSHVIELRPEGLYEETKFNQSIFFWSGLISPVRHLNCLCVYVTPQHAHVIPLRAFRSKQEQEAFLTELKDKIRAGNRP